MIDLLGLDLDGTLLSRTRQINDPTKQALANLIQKKPSLKVMILTGRSLFSTLKYVQELNELCKKPLVEYFCCYGGAKLYQLNNNQPQEQYKFLIDSRQVKTVFEIVEQHKGLFLAYLDKPKAPYIILGANQFYAWLIKQFWYKQRCEYFKNDHLTDGILKINVYFACPLRLKKVYQIIKRQFQDTLNVVNFSKHLIEITNKDGNKGYAIEAIAKKQGLSLKRMAVIGDSLNDRSMFEKVQYSFAMSKSPDELKLLATEIGTKTNRFRFSSLVDLITEKIIN
ncbi:Cof-type HAD-IIB family hydrolase [Mycoplasmoides pneumoniae]|uniref:Cof-type HAD-IIB family hydrolase n=1 Tax=Mycoplasmoides pneumoniae TaxID=2104 RepID=UPI001375791C|nr:Cof-type HAD-IIB family hydrolase [Mycoplasmoides pneumoniae]QHR19946.1 Cof-type HAD-IIB family hydrolase [Mycoplasmoides pneumoniae]